MASMNRRLRTCIALPIALCCTQAMAQEPVTPTLSGTWHLRMRTSTKASIPIIGTTLIKTTTHLLVHIAKNDSGVLHQTQQTCVVDSIPDRSLTRTILPPSFIQNLPVKTYPIKVAQKPDGSWSYDADLRQQHVGYRGELATTGIPQDKDHPAVFDWDNDGHPGATVLIDIPLFGDVAVYILQTNHTLLHGSVTTTDLIEGHTNMLLLGQRTIGASNRLLAANPTLNIGTGHSAFEIMRIDDDAQCPDIEKRARSSN
jgi:hypothetical protein